MHVWEFFIVKKKRNCLLKSKKKFRYYNVQANWTKNFYKDLNNGLKLVCKEFAFDGFSICIDYFGGFFFSDDSAESYPPKHTRTHRERKNSLLFFLFQMFGQYLNVVRENSHGKRIQLILVCVCVCKVIFL